VGLAIMRVPMWQGGRHAMTIRRTANGSYYRYDLLGARLPSWRAFLPIRKPRPRLILGRGASFAI
jgi:hypothetical protein